MGNAKDFKATVTISMDYTVRIKASDYDSASKMAEEYVKRHFLELEPDDRPFFREVNVVEAE